MSRNVTKLRNDPREPASEVRARYCWPFSASSPPWTSRRRAKPSLPRSPCLRPASSSKAKYPQLKGKTLVQPRSIPTHPATKPLTLAIRANTSVSTSISARRSRDASAFNLTYKPVTFAALLTTLSSGQARYRHLRHLRHAGARQGSRLHHVFQGVRWRAGGQEQPEEDHRHQYVDVRRRRGREHGLRRSAAHRQLGSGLQGGRKGRSLDPAFTTTTPIAFRRSWRNEPILTSTT